MISTTTHSKPLLTAKAKPFLFFSFLNHIQAILSLIILGFILYMNSISNEYALDDGIIIHQNNFVLEGARGIDSIIGRDAYRSFYKRMNASDQLSGGRYRPLSVVSFAVEQEAIGAYRDGNYPVTGFDLNKNGVGDPEEDLNQDGVFNEVDCQLKGAPIRHFNNVWTYILGCILLYILLKDYIFQKSPDMAYLASFLFLIHPIHTEVVANVKSRDEIFSLIFICLSFWFAFRFMALKNKPIAANVLSTFNPSLRSFCFAVICAVNIGLLYLLRKSGIVFPAFVMLSGFIVFRSFRLFIKLKAAGHTETLMLIAISFFLALLSKEYAVTLLILIPLGCFIFLKTEIQIKTLLWPTISFVIAAALMLYLKTKNTGFTIVPFLFPVCFYLFRRESRQYPFLIVLLVLYSAFLFYWDLRLNSVVIRTSVPNTELLNNPYLLANGEEIFCTKVYILLKYLTLAIFPHPLSSDYSFDTIAYRHFYSWDFWLSLCLHIALCILGFFLVRKRHPMGFAIAVYVAFLCMIGNILMDIGATMGERLLFHSTIGFSIAVSWLTLSGLNRVSILSLALKRIGLISCLIITLALCTIKTWERNSDWKNDISLFIRDVQTVPNSVLACGNAGARWIDLAETRFFSAPVGSQLPLPFESYREEMLDITVPATEFNDPFHVESLRDSARSENLSHQPLTRREKCLYKGIAYLKHAVHLHPRYVNGYLNLGLAYIRLNRDKEAIYYLKHVERLYPNNPYLQSYASMLYSRMLQAGIQKLQKNELADAAFELKKCVTLNERIPDGWYNLGVAYFNMNHYSQARDCWQQVLRLTPGHPQARAGMDALKNYFQIVQQIKN